MYVSITSEIYIQQVPGIYMDMIPVFGSHEAQWVYYTTFRDASKVFNRINCNILLKETASLKICHVSLFPFFSCGILANAFMLNRDL